MAQQQQQEQPALRVLSLLPSATDTVVSLELAHLLVGRSHECDWLGLQQLPAVTSSRLGDSLPVDEIDAVMVRSKSRLTPGAAACCGCCDAHCGPATVWACRMPHVPRSSPSST